MRITKRRPLHVGEVLHLEFMQPMGLTVLELARLLDIQDSQAQELLNGHPISEEMATRLASAFGNTPEFWSKLQLAVDQWRTKEVN
ncbi:putative antidote protein [Vibrio campbellii]|jgi:addiction module HigA family antidote|uniref:HigA family addiction module antitoxin n=1 Tax=Vibrio TaxID=662 RepID=UPI0001B945E7|nr:MULTISPECIES: HigA family addiction module antitoxin [Vibrio]EGQ8452224.1 HigA family addiction module antidote protein [Vibrio parahaemolyticus]EEX34092.1 antitoxin higA-1 [Vibrio coralliilyticus ATCC BAA-450]KGR33444.1 putative antidote protein [Vibrio campbellii]MBM4863574.1 HigA family addiction module antidote protein [Vibrio parahaemolyticus]MDE3899886.1 HigA family addiction module antidote protein [Vibrio sp. CC007]